MATGLLASALTAQPPAPQDYSIEDIQQGYADLLRADYEDWKNRFQPFETMYRDLLFDPEKHAALDAEALGYATDGVNNAYVRARNWQNLMNRKYGVELDADERASVGRRLGNERAALLSKTQTGMRDQLNQRDRSMLGYLNNLYTNDRKQALGQMGYLAGLDAQRQANNDAMRDVARQQQMQTIGSAVGTFGSMALMGNPVTGAVMGGLTLLGSLF